MFFALLVAGVLLQQSTDPSAFPGISPYNPDRDVAAERPSPEPSWGPATAGDAHFPLRVHVFATNRKFYGAYYRGSAIANVLGTPEIGLELQYKCSQSFGSNAEAGAFYQARWKKPNERLELLLGKPGGKKIEHCEADAKVMPAPYRP